MSDDQVKRLSESAADDDAGAFLRDAIRDSKRDLPDETRLAAIALKLGPVVAGGAAGGGGAAAASGAGAAKASAAPAAAKLGFLGSASMKMAAAVTVGALAIGGGAVVAPRVFETHAQVASTPTGMTRSSAIAVSDSASTNFSLPPASASALPIPVPASAATMIKAPDPDDETRNINRALDALGNDPQNALSICNDDAIIFPHGGNAQEREVIAIDALMRLGRSADAEARAKKFEHDFPRSAQLPRVRHLIGKN